MARSSRRSALDRGRRCASGRVYAQEIDERLVKKLGRRVRAEKLTDVEPLLGKPDAPGLPHGALDAVLLADVYHEVDNPSALLRGIRQSLKPEGRLVVIEYMKPELQAATRERQGKDHNIAPEFVERDLQEAGFAVTGRHDPLGPGYDRIPMYCVIGLRQTGKLTGNRLSRSMGLKSNTGFCSRPLR